MPVDAVPVNPGWSWTATLTVIQTVVIAVLGGGGLWGVFRGIALLWRMNNESKKQEADIAAALRKEMAEITERQQKRIDALEIAATEERKRHVEEMSAMRIHYEGEISNLRGQITRLTHQLFTMQQDSGKAVKMTTADVGDTLRSAFPVPDGD